MTGPRTAVVGNIAMNGWLITKYLRQYAGIEAVCFYAPNGQPMWHPEWEEAEVDVAALPKLGRPPTLDGWQRPDWAVPMAEGVQRPDFSAYGIPAVAGGMFLHCQPLDDPRPDRMSRLDRWAARQNYGRLVGASYMLDVLRPFDVVLFCGPFARYGALLSKRQPYLTLEHGTMRYVPRAQIGDERLLGLAYRYADWNILTNADCVAAAKALGLSRFSFVPHPVDTAKFSPAPPPPWRAELLEDYGAELLFFSPTRHATEAMWGAKRTDKTVDAFAQYVAVEEPAGAPPALLVLLDYGEGTAGVRRQIAKLGLEGRVYWMGLQPKRRLADWYRAADVVLDQWVVGSFGTSTVEAMACAKPVITWVDPAAHQWCSDVLPELPPVCNVREVPEIAAELALLARSPARRHTIGATGRYWVQRYHSPQRVADLHAGLLRRVVH